MTYGTLNEREEKLSMYTEAKPKSAQQVGHFEVVFLWN